MRLRNISALFCVAWSKGLPVNPSIDILVDNIWFLVSRTLGSIYGINDLQCEASPQLTLLYPVDQSICVRAEGHYVKAQMFY